jgi:hypothetical protein
LLSTDISNALEKAVEHLDNSVAKTPSVFIKHDKPFAMRMRMYKYVKAFGEQMKDKENVDENRYNHLILTSNIDGIMITSALETIPLFLTDEKGEKL